MIKVELFVSRTCPYCPAAKLSLEKAVDGLEDIKYEKVSISTKKGRIRASEYSIGGVPTLVIDGEILPGSIETDKVRYVLERKLGITKPIKKKSFLSKLIHIFKN